jgi:hypothetical protein
MPDCSTQPAADKHAPDFGRSIRLVPDGDVWQILAEHLGRACR